MADTEVHPDPSIRWGNRRRMAYISIIALIAMLIWTMGVGTYAIVVGKSLAEVTHIITILSTLAVGFVSIVGAYVGFATWGDKVLTDSVYSPTRSGYVVQQSQQLPTNMTQNAPYNSPYQQQQTPRILQRPGVDS
jgi:hypothetical protein